MLYFLVQLLVWEAMWRHLCESMTLNSMYVVLVLFKFIFLYTANYMLASMLTYFYLLSKLLKFFYIGWCASFHGDLDDTLSTILFIVCRVGQLLFFQIS